ncbi:hypothetical protein BdWA1_001029 [Babesia duncani]|uniref:Uncharacterized protein n=1 Tax=Babesia duncani TaxID=323732 RepID=A0AAD9UQL6_9APIC|nr:hypothetical protein BdWA1_001029 [Babesia duncani]
MGIPQRMAQPMPQAIPQQMHMAQRMPYPYYTHVQMQPPNMNINTSMNKNVNMGMHHPNINMGMQPPNMNINMRMSMNKNISMHPPKMNINTGMHPPNMNVNMSMPVNVMPGVKPRIMPSPDMGGYMDALNMLNPVRRVVNPPEYMMRSPQEQPVKIPMIQRPGTCLPQPKQQPQSPPKADKQFKGITLVKNCELPVDIQRIRLELNIDNARVLSEFLKGKGPPPNSPNVLARLCRNLKSRKGRLNQSHAPIKKALVQHFTPSKEMHFSLYAYIDNEKTTRHSLKRHLGTIQIEQNVTMEFYDSIDCNKNLCLTKNPKISHVQCHVSRVYSASIGNVNIDIELSKVVRVDKANSTLQQRQVEHVLILHLQARHLGGILEMLRPIRD